MNATDTLQHTPYVSAIQPPSGWRRFYKWWSGTDTIAKSEPVGDPSTYSPCHPFDQLNAYRILLADAKAIFVFRNGTAVFAGDRLSKEDAIEIMKNFGRTHAGTTYADFHVARIQDPICGFIVKYSHPAIIAYANHTDYPPNSELYVVGSFVRLGRHMDAYDLHIVASHIDSL